MKCFDKYLRFKILLIKFEFLANHRLLCCRPFSLIKKYFADKKKLLMIELKIYEMYSLFTWILVFTDSISQQGEENIQ